MPNGIIICTSSNLYQVKVEKTIYNCLARGKLKREGITPLVGDNVEITITDENKQEGVLEKILTRKNELKRPKMANLTQLIFIISMKMPSPDFLLLDKELAFAKYLGVKSVICFNKIDLVDNEKIEKYVKIYQEVGYPVISISAKERRQIEEIRPLLRNEITAFAGNSGVGKSTLLNTIFNQNLTQEGNISNKNKKGKNTTTAVTLYSYDESSYIADTPGFSTFEISEITSNELDKYFVEFKPYIDKCEFNGCNHIKEENCGIKKALQDKKITMERYQNYQRIYQELKEKEQNKW